ncbi:MAG TPA: hypothetical protein PKE48_15580, partial [Anaerolineales bacterium]|nr:hypothetical protein [Anaerolineales bacterium]
MAFQRHSLQLTQEVKQICLLTGDKKRERMVSAITPEIFRSLSVSCGGCFIRTLAEVHFFTTKAQSLEDSKKKA